MGDFVDYSDDEYEIDLSELLEDEYTYVDDGYHLADDLAETAVPSPPPFDTDDDWYDWDRFDYWHDYEDGSCGYFDYPPRKKLRKANTIKTGDKRKAGSTTKAPVKKMKTAGGQAVTTQPARPLSPTPTVLWRPQAVRRLDPRPKPLDLDKQQSYNIFKNLDKRTRANGTGKHPQVAVEEPQDLPEAHTHSPAPPLTLPEDVPEDVYEDGADNSALSIDPDALRAILQQRLSGGGPQVGNSDQDLLLQYAMRMLSGGDADALAGELAQSILGGVAEEGDEEVDEETGSDAGDEATELPNGGLSAWVAQQVKGSKQGGSTATSTPASSAGQTSMYSEGRNAATSSSTETSRSGRSSGSTKPGIIPPGEQHGENVGGDDDDDAAKPDQSRPPRSRKRKAEAEASSDSKRRAPSYAAATTSSKARKAVGAKGGTGTGRRG